MTYEEWMDLLVTLFKEPNQEVEDSVLIQELRKTGKVLNEKDIVDALNTASIMSIIYESKEGFWRRR